MALSIRQPKHMVPTSTLLSAVRRAALTPSSQQLSLVAYAFGELSAAEARTLENAMLTDDTLRDEAEDFRAVVEELKATAAGPSMNVLNRIMNYAAASNMEGVHAH